MALLQALLLILSLRYVIGDPFFTVQPYNGTEDWSIIRHIHMTVPLVVPIGDSLVHILDSSNRTHALELDSSDFKACRVPMELTFSSRYPRRAVSLGNGKLVVWLLNYRLTPYKHLGEWRFVLVEPSNCTVSGGLVISDEDPTPVDVIGVIGYQNTFDVLMTGLLEDEPRNTYVYRYNDKGEPDSSVVYSVIPDVDSEPFYTPNTIRVHAVKEYDSSEGYFYIQIKPEANSTIFKRLDSNFQILTEFNISNYDGLHFDTYSIDHGNFSVCLYVNERKLGLHCLLLDTMLKEKANIFLNYEDFEDYEDISDVKIVHVNVKNLPDGGVMLAFALKLNHRHGIPIFLQRISADGDSTGPTMFGKIYCEIYELRNPELKNGTYCVTVACDELVHTKCLKLRE